ncbi:carbohydrate ABC transporter permease, partial [Treponema sp. OttesenSCG-928-L16]|nr:carbohydrate ABC transporter permease [Treponema sp. OttesenSCG-928-L16]
MISKYKFNHYAEKMISYFLLMLLVCFAFFPILVIITGAFKAPIDIWSYPPKIFSRPALINFTQLGKENPRFFPSLKNSIIITGGALVITLLCSFMSAFALSRYKSRLLSYSAFFLIAIRMFPPIVITVPLYNVFRSIGLIDKHITLMIINAVFSLSMATMLMKTFVDDVPIELEEAAMIDGCSRFKSFWKITLPLTAPGITAVAIFCAIGVWNEYTFALIFSTTRAATTPI